MFKKSIVLSGLKGDEKAVLTLEEQDGQLNGRVRLYNFIDEPHGIISLGIYNNGVVTKAGLTRQSSMLYTFREQNFKIPQAFSCAVINFFNGQMEPLLYGSCESENKEEVLGVVFQALKNSETMSDVEKTLDSFGVDYDEDVKKEVDEAIEKEFQGQECDCAHCKYREYYLKNVEQSSIETLQEDDKDDIIIPKEEDHTFFEEIRAQVDDLFEKNPSEEYLEEVFPDSKWVRVEFDKGGDYYVLGLIYEEGQIKYVCYGVPGIYQKQPPKQLSGYPVWFPLDKEKLDGFGYWLTYQDAGTGESVKVVME